MLVHRHRSRHHRHQAGVDHYLARLPVEQLVELRWVGLPVGQQVGQGVQHQVKLQVVLPEVGRGQALHVGLAQVVQEGRCL